MSALSLEWRERLAVYAAEEGRLLDKNHWRDWERSLPPPEQHPAAAIPQMAHSHAKRSQRGTALPRSHLSSDDNNEPPPTISLASFTEKKLQAAQANTAATLKGKIFQQMARRRFQNPEPKKRGNWWYIQSSPRH